MVFSSVTFLYYFLPLTLAAYFGLPGLVLGWRRLRRPHQVSPAGASPPGEPGRAAAMPLVRLRNTILLVASLVFYAWGEPKYSLLMAAEITAFWLLGLLQAVVSRRRPGLRRPVLVANLMVGLGALVYFKYAGFFVGSLNRALGTDLPVLDLLLPIGISFYTFQMLSYAIDYYRGQCDLQRNLIDFACYVSLFPQLVAGPIVRYAGIADQLAHRSHSVALFAAGVRRFTIGLAKKVLIANLLSELVQVLRDSGDQSVLAAWLYVLAFGLQIYFDFSGYSDMAIGLGLIFGFHFPENFNYPYIARSITEFWRRWHMTLSNWFRDYLYIPLGGSRVPRWRHLVNIAIVWGLTGLWHGAAWQFVAWGLYFALFLSIEKYAFGGRLRDLPPGLGNLYLLGVVAIGWVFFDAAGFADAATTLGRLIGIGSGGLAGSPALYYLRSYAVIIAVGVLGATEYPRKAWHWLVARPLGPKLTTVIEPLAVAAGLVVATAYLIAGSFNPFIYFRF